MHRSIVIAIALLAVALFLMIRAGEDADPVAESTPKRNLPPGPRPLDAERGPANPSKSGRDKPVGPKTAAKRKLQHLVIPSFEVTNANLEDALHDLRRQSAKLDPEPDPLKKGFNVVIRLPSQVLKAGESFKPPQVTHRAENATVFDLLQALAAQSNMEVIVDDYVIALVPKRDPPSIHPSAVR